MKQNNYKPQIPDVMEAIFDAAYLIFDPDPDPLRRRCVSSGAANPESCTRKQ